MVRTYDYMVSNMSILCLWDIQLTCDLVGIEIHAAYPRKSEHNGLSVYRNF